MLEFHISNDFAGIRLDKYLRKTLPNVPASHLSKMIRVKKIRVNAQRAHHQQHVAQGDIITIRGDARLFLKDNPKKRVKFVPRSQLNKINILFEDDWMLAINKPAGLAVHAGSGITGSTIVDLVRAHLGAKAVRNSFAASPAHRLDKETSGVLIIAKRRAAMVHFTDVFTRHKARKTYLALLKGTPRHASDCIELPLAEHQQTAASKIQHGIKFQDARTHYKVLSHSSHLSLVECIIETGRTHQIRRHFAAIGHPLVGDPKHGDFAFNREIKAQWGLKRLFLHALRLECPHPAHKRRMTIEAPPPRELTEVVRQLKNNHRK